MADIKQRLGQYKKRYAKHVQRKLYNDRNGVETSTRTIKAIENNKHWIDHYEQKLNELINE